MTSVTYVEGAFSGIKLRLGREKISQDLQAIEVVRDAVGKDTSIMIDFNQALDMGEALDLCHQIDELGLYWLEEPFCLILQLGKLI